MRLQVHRQTGVSGAAFDAALQRTHHVFTRDHTDQSLIAFNYRDASDAVIDHELKHPRQLGFDPDVDEVGRHDIRDCLFHQVVIARYHASRRKHKTGEKVEL
jgi:hypothetical protein